MVFDYFAQFFLKKLCKKIEKVALHVDSVTFWGAIIFEVQSQPNLNYVLRSIIILYT